MVIWAEAWEKGLKSFWVDCEIFTISISWKKYNGGRAHYVIESKVQWKLFGLATQQYPQNDWLGGNLPYTMTYAHGPHSRKENCFEKLP